MRTVVGAAETVTVTADGDQGDCRRVHPTHDHCSLKVQFRVERMDGKKVQLINLIRSPLSLHRPIKSIMVLVSFYEKNGGRKEISRPNVFLYCVGPRRLGVPREVITFPRDAQPDCFLFFELSSDNLECNQPHAIS